MTPLKMFSQTSVLSLTVADVPRKSGPRRHSHIRSFLLLYPNSKSGKAFRDQFSTLGPSFYRKKTEAQRMTCP